jgi:hypothetical protein
MDTIDRVDDMVRKNIMKYTGTSLFKIRTKKSTIILTITTIILETKKKRCIKIICLNN